jgi:hypothetical protein
VEYIEIMLQDVSKNNIDLIIRQELKITKDIVVSSYFFDKSQQKDKEYSEIDSLVNYFSIPNTGNIYTKEITLGEKLYHVMVVISFDEDLGDITLNFKENDICNCDKSDLEIKLTKVVNELIEIQQKYDIKNIMLGYESVIDNENIILKISYGNKEIINKFKGKLASAIEFVYNRIK